MQRPKLILRLGPENTLMGETECKNLKCKNAKTKISRLGPENTLMGERRHKDEVDSADDSDGARAEQEEVKLEQSG